MLSGFLYYPEYGLDNPSINNVQSKPFALHILLQELWLVIEEWDDKKCWNFKG